MIVTNEEISSWEAKYRLKFINSISGYKGVHLIGTKNLNGISNVAIFNSVVHISSEPSLVGFIMRPLTVDRDTYTNIIESKYYTINHVQSSFVKKAHMTSANFPSELSEFELCNLTSEYYSSFHAPFVGESSIKIAMKLVEDVKMESSGCRLLVGEIQFVQINEDFIEQDGQIDLWKAKNVCVTGLNQYSTVKKFMKLPYARPEDVDQKNIKERPDNIVYDNETQTYNASLLPYGTNIGAPSITLTDVSAWKRKGINNFNHILKNKIERVKNEYEKLIEEYNVNELLYSVNYNFEPIIGAIYHLYSKDKTDEKFLSLIPPERWERICYGSFSLGEDKIWVKISTDNGR